MFLLSCFVLRQTELNTLLQELISDSRQFSCLGLLSAGMVSVSQYTAHLEGSLDRMTKPWGLEYLTTVVSAKTAVHREHGNKDVFLSYQRTSHNM